ncbi:MAG: glutamyl-tRNA reductase [Magnetococcales bacterium]|nr:glutamyl-tRNA reductase [Magnetococcales bacterium]
MKLIVVGLNHKTTPVALRERLAFANEEYPAALSNLLQQEGMQEGLLLSTCNRVEIYAVCGDPDSGVATVSQWLAQSRSVDTDTLLPHLYHHIGNDAVQHGMRVAASLDSLVVGEAQILGQMKQAYREAVAIGSARTVLNRYFHLAFQVAKQIRTETQIARHPVSIASVAVTLARKIFGELDGHSCLLLGAGEMCELAARHLSAQGVRIRVANRTLSRAQALAESFQGQGYALDELATILPQADIIISSTGSTLPLVSAAMVRAALKQRRQRPQFYIDIAVPRDLDPKISDVDNAFLYDIDDLAKIVADNQKDRSREMVAAEGMILGAVPSFSQWLETLEVVPTLVALRQKMEQLRDQEVAKAIAGWSDLNPEGQKRLESMARLLVNKILHSPLSQLRQLATEADGSRYVDATRKLFELE